MQATYDGFHAVARAQFARGGDQVQVDGGLGAVERGGDALGRQPLGRMLQALTFSTGETNVRAVAFRRREQVGDLGLERMGQHQHFTEVLPRVMLGVRRCAVDDGGQRGKAAIGQVQWHGQAGAQAAVADVVGYRAVGAPFQPVSALNDQANGVVRRAAHCCTGSIW
jgi:hypothetical protein